MFYPEFDKDMEKILDGRDSVTLDFSIPEHSEFFLKKYGGEELLRTKYKAFYNAFLRTKKAHTDNAIANSNSDEKPYCSTVKIKPAVSNSDADPKNVDSTNILAEAEAKVHVDSISRVIINGSVRNFKTNQKYATIAADIRESLIRELNGNCKVGQACMIPKNEDLLTGALCNFDYFNNNSNIPFSSEIKQIYSSKANIFPPDDAIDKIIIHDPKINDENMKKGCKTISINYKGRAFHPDYDYPNIEVEKNKSVRTMLPIKGEIHFNSNYVPKNNGYYTDIATDINMRFASDNSVAYNHERNEIARFFEVNEVNKQVVSFEFNADWNSFFASDKVGSGIVAYLEANFRYLADRSGETEPYAVPISIISIDKDHLPKDKKYYESDNSLDVYIPGIQYYWGCFGKDTMILMANGEEKLISSIVPGDLVAVYESKPAMVEKVIHGPEEMMIHVESENGKFILLTDSHPVLTERGVVSAAKLDITDNLIMQDGSKSKVKYLYTVKYSDEVYNLDLNSPNMIIANGFVAGDFHKQNSHKNEAKVLSLSPDGEELFKELDILLADLKQKSC